MGAPAPTQTGAVSVLHSGLRAAYVCRQPGHRCSYCGGDPVHHLVTFLDDHDARGSARAHGTATAPMLRQRAAENCSAGTRGKTSVTARHGAKKSFSCALEAFDAPGGGGRQPTASAQRSSGREVRLELRVRERGSGVRRRGGTALAKLQHINQYHASEMQPAHSSALRFERRGRGHEFRCSGGDQPR